MANVVPYINFVDKSHEALEFYKGVFGGDAETQSEGERVIHLDFRSGDIHFMGGDHQDGPAGLRSSDGYGVVLNCDSEDELRDFYAKLADGGTVLFEPVDSGWGAIVAHCADQFGVSWMLNFDAPQS